MIIIEEVYGEVFKLLASIACPEGKSRDEDECEGINQKGYMNCWDCLAKTIQIDLKFGEMRRESYVKPDKD